MFSCEFWIVIACIAVFVCGLICGVKWDAHVKDVSDVTYIVAEMRANSGEWNTNNQIGRIQLAAKNQALASILHHYGVEAVYDAQNGVWYVDKVGGDKLYDEY